MSLFSELEVELGPPVAIFALMKAFNEDTFEKKVNLTAGVYRTAEGKPWVLPVVRHVERKLADNDSLNKEYLPILGLESFSIAATTVVNDPEVIPATKSQFTLIVRGMYSSPPSHGARIVEYVLTNPELLSQWEDHIKTMSSRIIDMRKQLREALEQLDTPGNWSHLTKHIGMFSYTGLNEIQSEHMVKKHHVYLLCSGRISMAGLNPSNVHYVAKAIHETVSSIPSKI
ncbi:unnamed protein product [Psylliodes chrysocephalus]|uniref:aspartate transaminase n=1 Tax=Psylliodes chrysocephalus TaxID=3402493 RepID=A0A9P0CM66_9CUCU|nr:unnamed protein product [Psylliodes chrysocephala]